MSVSKSSYLIAILLYPMSIGVPVYPQFIFMRAIHRSLFQMSTSQ